MLVNLGTAHNRLARPSEEFTFIAISVYFQALSGRIRSCSTWVIQSLSRDVAAFLAAFKTYKIATYAESDNSELSVAEPKYNFPAA